MRRLWLVLGSVAAVAAVGGATFGAISLVAHEEEAERATFATSRIGGLVVDNDNGTVEIIGGDVDEITVDAEVSHGLRRTKTRAEVEGDTLVVDMDCPAGPHIWCSADYRIIVPTALELDVDVDNRNGSTVLRDLGGRIHAVSSNGPIELVRLDGPVDARTRNGSVDGRGLTGSDVHARSSNGAVRLTFAEAPTTVTARTRNGAVEVVVPDDGEAYRVEVESFVGATDAAVRTDPASERLIVAVTRNGAATVRYPTG